jgi:hypothetical protein
MRYQELAGHSRPIGFMVSIVPEHLPAYEFPGGDTRRNRPASKNRTGQAVVHAIAQSPEKQGQSPGVILLQVHSIGRACRVQLEHPMPLRFRGPGYARFELRIGNFEGVW